MHVQIVTFNLGGMSEGEYIDVASRLAPQFAGLSGLLAKVWLESPDAGVYGAVYFWNDEEAMERFLATDLFEGTNPSFANFSTEDFSVLENLTRATQPVLTVLEDRSPSGRAPARPAVTAGGGAAPAPAPAPAPEARARVTKVTTPTGKASGGRGGATQKSAPTTKARSAPPKARP